MPRTFNDYGPKIREFLLKAFNEGVKLDDPLCTPARLKKLQDASLIVKRQSKKGRMNWRLTDLGRGLVMQHEPVFLHSRGFPSYTLKHWQAMQAEGECVGERNPGATDTSKPTKRPVTEPTLRESLAKMKERNAERYAA